MPTAGSRRWVGKLGWLAMGAGSDSKKSRPTIARVLALLDKRSAGEVSLVKLLRRPEMTWGDVASQLPELAKVPRKLPGRSSTT